MNEHAVIAKRANGFPKMKYLTHSSVSPFFSHRNDGEGLWRNTIFETENRDIKSVPAKRLHPLDGECVLAMKLLRDEEESHPPIIRAKGTYEEPLAKEAKNEA